MPRKQTRFATVTGEGLSLSPGVTRSRPTSTTMWISLFLFPAITIFIGFYAYPLLTVLATAFTDWGVARAPVFVGIQNFLDLFQDRIFHASLWNMARWLAIGWTISISLALTTALLTAKKTLFNRIFRVIYLVPNMISIAALAMTFFFMFNPSFGLVNQFIQSIGFPDFTKNWYFEADSAFFAVTATTIFFTGILMLLISAEIASIPDSLTESAQIDGASQWQINVRIILPMIKNIIGTCMTLIAVGVLRSFEVITLTTLGGPGTETMNLSLYLYNTALKSNNYGYANAIGTVIIVLGITLILIINRTFRLGTSVHID